MAFIAATLGAAWPRLMVLGGLPATDEGVYAYHAQLIHHSLATGQALPDSITLAFYPMLLSWVFGLDVNAFVLLRALDLLAAMAMALLLFRVLLQVGNSTLGASILTVLFSFAMNQPIFIQNGFKNSIAAAFVPLLLALLLGQGGRPDQMLRWCCVGALTALAILLRETFAPFAFLGLITLALTRGLRPAVAFAAGGIATSVVIVGSIVAARGGWQGLLESYSRASIIYRAVQDQRVELFILNGLGAVKATAPALILAGILTLALVHVLLGRQARTAVSGAAFWLAVAALPLVEPVSKIGFPYHFAVALPGLAGLSALAWRHLAATFRPAHLCLCLAGFLAIASMAERVPAMWQAWPATRAVLATSGAMWPEHAVQRSNYLLAADLIKQALPTTGGSLAVSGFMFTLYPLTGTRPSTPELAHLTESIISADYSASALRNALLRCPPDVLMTTTRTEWPGRDEIRAAVQGTGLYSEVGAVPVSTTRDYGSFGGTVYRLERPHACTRP